MTLSQPRPSQPPRRTVFYSVAAQWDNLGDIEIRNAALEWIRGTGSCVIAYSGSMPPAYVAAFDTDERVRFVNNPVHYQAFLWSFLLRRRASMVFAPGPQVYGPSVKAMGKSLVNLLNVAAVRASGGSVLAVGRSLRGRGRLARRIEVAVVAMFQLYVVRDTRSAAVLEQYLVNAPDLAFAHDFGPTATCGTRTDVVISLRGDRPINVDGLSVVVDVIKSKGLRPLFVTQVKRDDEQHRSLAARFGVSAVLWESHSHSDQLIRARSAYANAGAVISNRLHALIFGIQHGAAPIAVLDKGSDKLASTLRPWVTLRTTTPDFNSVDGLDWTSTDVVGLSDGLAAESERARIALANVEREFVKLLSAPIERAREVRR